MPDTPSPTIRRVTRLDLPVDDWHWPFADARRAEIDAHFARQREAKPALWNGRVLLARDPQFVGDAFHARYFETDFASFLAWRDWGFPDRSVINGFGMGALRGDDGGFVLGEMAPHTANAGKVYFASGTPDLSDLHDGRVDIAASVAREVAEETGFSPDDYTAAETWDCVTAGRLVAMIRVLDFRTSAASISARMTAAIAKQTEPELSAACVVMRRRDITSAMPDFIACYLAAQFDDTSPARRESDRA